MRVARVKRWRSRCADWARKVTVEEKKKLYLAEPRTLLDIVHETPGHVRTLLIVGHNPGLAAFAGELAGSGDPRALAGDGQELPDSALAVLDFEWRNGPRLISAAAGSTAA